MNDHSPKAERVHKSCPTCGCGDPANIPPEPPVGTWVRDRFGATNYHQVQGGWGVPGTMPFARWHAMWTGRGPLVECGPWGAELTTPPEGVAS